MWITKRTSCWEREQQDVSVDFEMYNRLLRYLGPSMTFAVLTGDKW